jgi:hypothetical protein
MGYSQTVTFDLRGDEVSYGTGDEMVSGYSASHLSIIGPDMMDIEDLGLTITGELKTYVDPENASGSDLIKLLNPPVQYPSVDMNVRAFDVTGDMHEGLLTAGEYRLLIEMADNGGQFYSRENAPGQNY